MKKKQEVHYNAKNHATTDGRRTAAAFVLGVQNFKIEPPFF